MVRTRIVSLALAFVLVFSLVAIIPSSPTAAQSKADYVAGELIVQFRADATDAQKNNVRGLALGHQKQVLRANSKGKGQLELIATKGDVQSMVKSLSNNPAVEFAEPNYIYTLDATSSDPYYTSGNLWGMESGFGSNAETAWAGNVVGSDSVYIGIIDEGIQVDHPDLDGNVWVNQFDPIDGVDNDGNGYVDDVNGWDFDGNNNQVYDGGKRGNTDDHGTHVAGTIGAEADGSGVVGVNWNVTMISGKFLGRRGGTTANAILAVDYFTDLKQRHGLNIVATNNSWGGGGYSQALYDAISRANAADILFIAAAGNSGTNNDTSASYPSNYNLSNVIAVAAIDSNGNLASFSQYGATTVDLGAPGVGIYSTTAKDSYSSYNGTSMATPHVAGAAALYASANPGASAAQIKNALLSSAVPTASLNGKVLTDGRLDAYGALSK